MAVSKNEVGHALNVASFEKLIISCRGLGRSFNPVNTSLQLANLDALLQAGKQAIGTVSSSLNAYSQAVAKRQAAFADIKVLCTRIVASLLSCGASASIVRNAKTINTRLQGSKGNNNGTESLVSKSHQSYTQITANFAQLVDFVSRVAEYQPNEPELQAATLLQKAQGLDAANTELMNAEANLKASRTQRNELLYNEQTGLVPTGLLVKTYAKSLLSAKSPDYKAIQGIAFRMKAN